jgi:phage baseplate assembly protein W
MADIPHFALPFRVANGRAVVNDQDTSDDVVTCVVAVMLCPTGYRAELPEFGIDDPTFREGGPDQEAIATAIQRWEPRADALLESPATPLDELAFTVSAFIGTRSAD